MRMNIPLNIDWQQILLHLFNFAILAAGSICCSTKPVRQFMEKREAHYREMEGSGPRSVRRKRNS